MNTRFENRDCMEVMKEYPDNYFDLAVVDPPYFSGPEKRGYYGNKISSHGVKRIEYNISEDNWEPPTLEYYIELVRISKAQIIWGINYFDFPVGSGRIIWDKRNGNNSFSDCEIAFNSLHDSVRLFTYMWNGMMQGSTENGSKMQGDKSKNEKKIHPTQKPLQLYKWIYEKYLSGPSKVIDTHLSSFSSAIAASRYEVSEFVGCEIDNYQFEVGVKRFKEQTKQLKLV